MGRCQSRIATEVAVPQDGLQFREGFKDYHLGVNSSFIPIFFFLHLASTWSLQRRRLWWSFPSSGQNPFSTLPFNQNPEILIFAFLTKANSKIQRKWTEKGNDRTQTRGMSAFGFLKNAFWGNYEAAWNYCRSSRDPKENQGSFVLCGFLKKWQIPRATCCLSHQEQLPWNQGREVTQALEACT